MLIQMCKISKVFSINFILIRCGSVPYNYKAENVFAVCHMIRHTANDFAMCHSTGHTAKLAEATAAAPTSLPCAGSRGTRQREQLCCGPDRGTRQSAPPYPL